MARAVSVSTVCRLTGSRVSMEGGVAGVARSLGVMIAFAVSLACLEAQLQALGCSPSSLPFGADEPQHDWVGSACFANAAQQQRGLATKRASRTAMMLRR